LVSQETVATFLDDLASSKPAPGGGSAAALTGGIAAGLLSMVGNLTVGKEKFKEVEGQALGILERSEALRAEMVRLIQADIDAFGEVSAAYKLPRATDEQKATRSQAIQASLVTATEAPLAIARTAREILDLCESISAIGNPQVISDAGVGALSAEASLNSAILNVEINLNAMKDAEKAAGYRAEADRLLAGHAETLARTLATVRERM
jgi:formiminotetrahydrofolate cyclodeaminase